MNLRLFIAIAVPEDIKLQIRKVLAQIQPSFRSRRDIRWVSEDNWHFTVIFLGSEPESAVPLIRAAMAETSTVLKSADPKSIDFEKIVYGPKDRPGNLKRMIWLTGTGNTSKQLGKLKETLEKNLKDRGVEWAGKDYGDYHAHLTLARFEPVNFKDLPALERKLDWHYEAKVFDLMESHLARSGATYQKLFSVDF